jgi:hypothetical protein
MNAIEEFVEFAKTNLGNDGWISAFKRIESPNSDGCLYCALIENNVIPEALNSSGWDIMLSSGGPGFSVSYPNGEMKAEYYTESHDSFRRIILYRSFEGRKESYTEICEEFRLIFNLHHDIARNIYCDIDECGDDIEVIKYDTNEVKIRGSYLKRFSAVRQMSLVLFFELTAHADAPLSLDDEFTGENLRYSIYSGPSYNDQYSHFTRTLGKKIIRCGPIESCKISPYEGPKEYSKFIIGGEIDSQIEFSCNHNDLSNHFGANPGAPHYLTPVFFKKEVMKKYYGSEQYTVSDGYLARNGTWGIRIDNNNADYITVYLGDLGRDLPLKEQKYWQSFNILPDGRFMSKTNFQRSIMGIPFDPENPEHKFKQKFNELQRLWFKEYNWHIFLPLSPKDKHFFDGIHSLLSNDQSEFDSQILSIAKTTIDSINVAEIRKNLNSDSADEKSISLLHEFLKKLDIDKSEEYISFLRGVQSIRSSGVAHRKGSEYEKVTKKLGISSQDLISEFDEILLKFSTIFGNILQRIQHPNNEDVG